MSSAKICFAREITCVASNERPQVEEVAVDADLLELQYFSEDFGERLLVGRSTIFGALPKAVAYAGKQSLTRTRHADIHT